VSALPLVAILWLTIVSAAAWRTGHAARFRAVRVSAKVDYALRACAELAAAGEGPVKGDRIAQAQEIPLKFLENILLDLKAGQRQTGT
jgi:Iron-dependent Transcriptional regulator